MKIKLLSLIILFCVLQSRAQIVQPKPVSIKIYGSGAELTHQASVNVSSGTQKISFRNLPSEIFPASVRLSSSGNPITILTVEYRKDFITEKGKIPRFRSLEDSLELLKDQSQEFQNRLSVLEEEKNLLLANRAIGGSNTGVNSVELLKMADIYRTRLADIYEKSTILRKKSLKIQAEMQRIQQQMDELGNQGTYISEVVAEIDAKSSGNCTFSLSYFTQLVSWEPLYDLYVRSDKKQIEVVNKAKITQNTGFDFKNLNVTFSTAQPNFNITKPELAPWWIDFYQAVNYYNRPQVRGARVESMAKDAPAAPAYEATSTDASSLVVQTESTLSVEYSPQIELDLQNGESKTIALANVPLEATFEYVTAPRQRRDVILVANATGFDALNFANGSANLYFDNAFIGTTQILDNVVDDTLKLPLGSDRKLAVEYKTTRSFTADKKLVNKRKRSISSTITLRNNRKDDVEIRVQDQIPLTQNKDILVETEELSGAELNTETGILTWKIKLSPGETKKLKVSYSIQYPKDKNISGI